MKETGTLVPLVIIFFLQHLACSVAVQAIRRPLHFAALQGRSSQNSTLFSSKKQTHRIMASSGWERSEQPSYYLIANVCRILGRGSLEKLD